MCLHIITLFCPPSISAYLYVHVLLQASTEMASLMALAARLALVKVYA
jgi:hypothetical protein